MIAWAHVLAWPVAAVAIAFQVRRAVIAAALAYWSRDSGDDLVPPAMAPVPGFESKDAVE